MKNEEILSVILSFFFFFLCFFSFSNLQYGGGINE